MQLFRIKIQTFLLLCALPCLGKEFEPIGKVSKKYATVSEKTKLCDGLGCRYMNNMEIDYNGFSDLMPEETQHYTSNSMGIDGNSIKYEQQTKEWLLTPMYLKWVSKEIGYGVFAGKKIAAGGFIGVYAGQLRLMRSADEMPVEDVDYAWYYPINATNDKRLLVDGKFEGNELRFINHHTDPNTQCIDVLVDGVFYLIYVATRDIAKDEELTVSYGSGYWDSRKITPA